MGRRDLEGGLTDIKHSGAWLAWRSQTGLYLDWRRLLVGMLLTFTVMVFFLHMTLSIVSVPPPGCGTNYMKIPDDISSKNKVLLAAYYRSGSSFFGKLFQSNEDVLYWFEPLRPLHGDFKYQQQVELFHNDTDTGSDCTPSCQESIKQDHSLLRAIFSCDIATVLSISQQIIAYAHMRLYVPTFPQVFDKLGRFSPLPYKIQPNCLAGRCDSVQTIAAKTIRLRMHDAAPLLDLDPKLKVIYYTRDPRGIVSSLVKLGEVRRQTVAGMCAMMQNDFHNYQLLKEMYPERIMWLRYEDLAMQPLNITNRIYKFSTGKRCVPSSVHSWIAKNTNAKKSEYNGITGTRRNSTANAHEWQNVLDSGMKNYIRNQCLPLLKSLRYV